LRSLAPIRQANDRSIAWQPVEKRLACMIFALHGSTGSAAFLFRMKRGFSKRHALFNRLYSDSPHPAKAGRFPFITHAGVPVEKAQASNRLCAG